MSGVRLPDDPPRRILPPGKVPVSLPPNDFGAGVAQDRRVLKFPQDFVQGANTSLSARINVAGNCFSLLCSSATHPRQAGAFAQVFSNPPPGVFVARNIDTDPRQLPRETVIEKADHAITFDIPQLVDPSVNLYGWVQGSVSSRGLMVQGYPFQNLSILPLRIPGVALFTPAGTADPTLFTIAVGVWTDTSKPYSVDMF